MSLELWVPRDRPEAIESIAGRLEQVGYGLEHEWYTLFSLVNDVLNAWKGDAAEQAIYQLDSAFNLLAPPVRAFTFGELGYGSAPAVLRDYAQRLARVHAEVDRQRQLYADAISDRVEIARMAGQASDPFTRERAIQWADENLAAAKQRILRQNQDTMDVFVSELGGVVMNLSGVAARMHEPLPQPFTDGKVDPGFAVQPGPLRTAGAALADWAGRIEGTVEAANLPGLPRPQESTLPTIFADILATGDRQLRSCAQIVRKTSTGIVGAVVEYESSDQKAGQALEQATN